MNRHAFVILLTCLLAAAGFALVGCDQGVDTADHEVGNAAPATATPPPPAPATQPAPAVGGDPGLGSQSFVEQAAAAGKLEIRLAEIAQERAESQEVKDFAQMIVDDHTQAAEELKEVAEGLSLTVPAELPADKQQTVDRFAAMSGEEFDREYARLMVDDHHKAVNLFQQATIATNVDPDLQHFASSVLPTLEKHLDHAQDLPGGATYASY